MPPLAARQAYAEAAALSTKLFNGPEYVNYALQYAGRKGNQFFESADARPGSVHYSEHLFENVPLRYDLLLDQVVVSAPENPLLLLRLVDEKLPQFTIGSHQFVRLLADSTGGAGMATGYYEVLSEGGVQLLARRTKRERKELNDRSVVVEFLSADRLFARKGNTYYALGSKSAALRLFTDRATEVQAYLRQNRIKLSKANFEASLIQVANYYNQLPPR
ncbi:hypothetical protein J7E24_01295 [Hymenobacter sp. ISL-91]|uniref:hypothetical protein n=1 Tax=Hymenobacter sp. ISL-91 TaxID=2819151 RepID=UPI001BE90546|nr:hypothetical protein [Hymenobacter sp. ISL-91]MBT2556411.1 hypothetical protein [Hymenobacter sp. ISL-91]